VKSPCIGLRIRNPCAWICSARFGRT